MTLDETPIILSSYYDPHRICVDLNLDLSGNFLEGFKYKFVDFLKSNINELSLKFIEELEKEIKSTKETNNE